MNLLPNIFNKVSFIDKLLFTKHLGIMLKAGIPIEESIENLFEHTKNPRFKKILKKVGDDVKNGKGLGESLKNYPDVFDNLYRNIVSIGEESGNLETNLEHLAIEMAKTYEFNRKVKGVLLYPGIILTVAFVVGGGVVVFVLPQLVDLFKSLEVTLPLSTKILLGFAQFMKSYGVVTVVAFGLASIGFNFFINLPGIKFQWQKLLLNIPVLKDFIINLQVTNFCRNLGLMLKSGLPINTALASCEDACDNLVFKGYIHSLSLSVEKGNALEKELSNGKYPYLPGIVSRMIGVGEKTGKLDESLFYLADFFSEEIDEMAKNLPVILEPLLLTVVALGVAFLAMSIISPIYQFSSGIKR